MPFYTTCKQCNHGGEPVEDNKDSIKCANCGAGFEWADANAYANHKKRLKLEAESHQKQEYN